MGFLRWWNFKGAKYRAWINFIWGLIPIILFGHFVSIISWTYDVTYPVVTWHGKIYHALISHKSRWWWGNLLIFRGILRWQPPSYYFCLVVIRLTIAFCYQIHNYIQWTLSSKHGLLVGCLITHAWYHFRRDSPRITREQYRKQDNSPTGLGLRRGTSSQKTHREIETWHIIKGILDR